MADDPKTTVAVAVCTYNRNGPLEVLLEALLANTPCLGNRAAVGVVVVDDSSEGNARSVVARFEGRFELGTLYRLSGRQNISIARNLAIDAAAELAEWVAMTDDDCEPVPEWLEALLEAQRRTQADAVTGPYRRRVPPGAPSWLRHEPFLEIATDPDGDGDPVASVGTNNSMISSAWWQKHPEARFSPVLGVTGGEDMVFYRRAHAAGLRVSYAQRAVVYENEPPSRLRLGYQLWHFFWIGNSSYVTRLETGQASRLRMFLQGGNTIRKALTRTTRRTLSGQTPQLRYCLATILQGLGTMIGPLGIRIPHH